MAIDYIFEWDPRKADANERKHSVAFDHASGVFADPRALTIYDGEHSSLGEDRWVTMGKVDAELLVVVHTFIDLGTEIRIRIITARKAGASERRHYGENQQ